MSVSCNGGDVTWNLKVDTSATATNIGELNRLLTTYVSLARRVGLPENIMDSISRIQQLRVAAETAYRSIMMLYAGSGPYGWLIAVGGLAISGLMLIDQMEMRRSSY